MNYLKNIDNKLLTAGLLLFAFVLPIHKMATTIPFIIIIIGLIPSYKQYSIKELSKYSIVLVSLLIIYFILAFNSYFHAIYKLHAKNELIGKIPFFLLPLLLTLYQKIETTTIKKIVTTFFISSYIMSIIIMFIYLFNLIYYNKITSYTDLISFTIIHPSYLSLYLLFGLILFMDNKYLTDSIKSNILYKTYPFVVSVTIIILASRISIIALVILFIIYIFFILKLKQALFATLLICLLSIFLFWKVDFLNARFTKAINMLKQDKNAVNNYTVDDRIMIWSNAIELIKEEPIKGYNIGDARNHFLREKHNTSGFGKGYREHYNCHNQFLESWLSLGILGVITMILIFATLLYIGIIEKNKVIIGFTLLLFIFSLVESILESQGGIMFFAFFVGLFLNKLKHV